MKALVILVIVIVAFLVTGLVVEAAWAWIIPDIFRGAVEQGIIPMYLEYGQALKLGFVIWFMGVFIFGGSK